MTEIEKLYENAGVEKDCVVMHECLDTHHKCRNCNKTFYPTFTAEKQLELMAFIINTGIQVNLIKKEEITVKAIAEGLACATNEIWQDLSKDEQQQIKEILQ